MTGGGRGWNTLPLRFLWHHHQFRAGSSPAKLLILALFNEFLVNERGKKTETREVFAINFSNSDKKYPKPNASPPASHFSQLKCFGGFFFSSKAPKLTLYTVGDVRGHTFFSHFLCLSTFYSQTHICHTPLLLYLQSNLKRLNSKPELMLSATL